MGWGGPEGWKVLWGCYGSWGCYGAAMGLLWAPLWVHWALYPLLPLYPLWALCPLWVPCPLWALWVARLLCPI